MGNILSKKPFRRLLAVSTVGLALSLSATLADAAICKTLDAQGKVHYAQCANTASSKVSVKQSSQGVTLTGHRTESGTKARYGGAVVAVSKAKRPPPEPVINRPQ